MKCHFSRYGRWVLFALAMIEIQGASAVGSVVTNTNDSGSGSLREALFGTGTITFDLPGPGPHVIALQSGLQFGAWRTTILNDRVGDESVTIQGSNPVLQFRIFDISYATQVTTIAGVTIKNGVAFYGGAILYNGTLILRNCVLTENQATYGGAISGSGDLVLENCVLRSNVASHVGGALRSGGPTTLRNCLIADNSTMGDASMNRPGGAIYNEADLKLINCTFSHNSAPQGTGGAIFGASTIDIKNCTFDRNVAAYGGDSLGVSLASVVISNSIFRHGSASGNFFIFQSGTATSLGYNLCDDGANGGAGAGPGGVLNGPGDIRNTNPRLDPAGLRDNGGPTQTVAILADSPAIDGGDDANAPVLDQRGYVRAGSSDIGAFEFGGTIASPTTVLGNISTRLRVETGDDSLIGGFIVSGTHPKRVILRAIGPSLVSIADRLANPTIELHDSAGALIAFNDNWRSDQEAEIMGTGIQPADDLESAIVMTLPADNAAYTAVVRGANGETGVALVEVYDLERTVDSKLANISTRGLVGASENVLIAGTIVLGAASQTVLLRAIGPSLPVQGNLNDPTIELRDSNGELIASNDNWRSDQEEEIIATAIPPTNDSESAILTTLGASGAAYTAIVRGNNETTGIAVVEVYALN